MKKRTGAYFSRLEQGEVTIYLVEDFDNYDNNKSVFVEGQHAFMMVGIRSDVQTLSENKKQLQHLIYILQQIEKDMD